jgi:hypothetical protein
MNKGTISNLFRLFRLSHLLDYMRYLVQRFKNRKINSNFRKDNPGIKLPPDYLMYESFQLNYHKYYTESKESAKWVIDFIGPYIKLEN